MKKIILTILCGCFLLTSCHDDLEQKPNSSISTDTFFNTLEESTIAINGVYNAITQGTSGAYGQFYLQMACHGSHVSTMLGNQPKQNLYAQYTFDNSDQALRNIWGSNYKAIFRANQAIERIGKIDSENPLKNRLIAEAKFVRALCYFNMVRWWGDLPLIDFELVDFSNVNIPRSPSSEVYDLIITDLKFAEEHLYLPSWVTDENIPSYDSSDLGRATVGTAKGLLAKVYLTRASYPLMETSYVQMAYDKSKEVVNDGHYILEADYGSLFTISGEQSHEWMFQIQMDSNFDLGNIWGGVNNPNGHKDAVDRGFGRYNPTLSLVESYAPEDPRFLHNIAKGTLLANNTIKYNRNQVKWYAHKFRFDTQAIGRFVTDMNAPVLRYADILLIYAEAAAKLGLDTEAYDAIDLVLDRARGAGVSPVPVNRTLSGDDLLNAIMWERAKELCFEGTSKFDIVRMGPTIFEEEVKNQLYTTNETSAGATKPVPWKDNIDIDKHMLFPIPEAEMNGNTALIGNQNPGYN